MGHFPALEFLALDTEDSPSKIRMTADLDKYLARIAEKVASLGRPVIVLGHSSAANMVMVATAGR